MTDNEIKDKIRTLLNKYTSMKIDKKLPFDEKRKLIEENRIKIHKMVDTFYNDLKGIY